MRGGVVAGAFPVSAAAGGCGDRGSSGADRLGSAEVLLPRIRLSPEDLRRASARTDSPAPQDQPAVAWRVGDDRLGVGRPARRTAGTRFGRADQPVDTAAAVTRCAGEASEHGAGGRHRRLRHPQRPDLLNHRDRHADPPADRRAARQGSRDHTTVAGRASGGRDHLPRPGWRLRIRSCPRRAAGDPNRRSVPSLAEPRRGSRQDRVRPPRLPGRTCRHRGYAGRSGLHADRPGRTGDGPGNGTRRSRRPAPRARAYVRSHASWISTARQ